MVLWRVDGLANTPVPIWADQEGRFFGITVGLDWLPEAYAGEMKALETAQAAALAKEGPALVSKVVKTPSTPVAFTHVRLFDADHLAFRNDQTVVVEGGKITAVAAHEDGKADYSAEVATLASAGGDILIVAGYLDQGGKGMIQAALDTGAFDKFMLPDGMVGESLTDHFKTDIDGSIGTNPGTDSPGAAQLAKMSADKGFKGDDPYVPERYDASALLLLAMQSANSTDSAVYKDHVTKVANAPGEKIYPGELAKALKILAEGGEIDYVGGSAVELIGPGEAAGNFRESEVMGGVFKTVQYH